MPELLPGVLASVLTKAAAQVDVRSAESLGLVAEAVADQARHDVTRTSHAYGTKTPSRNGYPPSRISGTLASSITTTFPARGIEGWSARVGPKSGMYPWYSVKYRTSSSQYGAYLEHEIRSGVRYPWLYPAAMTALPVAIPTVFPTVFSRPWAV